MILYDDKHNFLGMSSHTLGFLGYEDIGDFLSLQNDFANLFVNKEGYIYNFENFNWIDFVLYSGSANKSAIVTLKNGQETKVDLSIKEVHLANELGDIKKLYSVKLISNNFHEISGIPKSNEGVNGFNLNALVEKEPQEEIAKEEIKLEEKKDDFQELIDDSKKVEETKTESFILNIADDELVSKDLIKEDEHKEEVSLDTQNDFHIEFGQDDSTIDKLDNTPEIEIKTESSDSGFFLKKEDNDKESLTVQTDESEDTQNDTKETFGFTLLNEKEEISNDIEVETPNLNIESNLLKSEDSLSDNYSVDTEAFDKEIDTQNVTPENIGFKLDFLTKEENVQYEDKSFDIKSEDSQFKETNKDKIIEQIKDDIKEIDEVVEDSDETIQEDSFILDIPNQPQVEQPLNIDNSLQPSNSNEIEDDIDQNTLSNLQIDESKQSNINNSFTDTLKGLFGGNSNQDTIENSSNDDSETFKFKLKSDTELQENKTTYLNTDIKNSTKDEINEQNDLVKQKDLFSPLSSLGLNHDDEYDLLNDFILDAKESIETIEEFLKTKDFDKINYALVKIKSSAEILNLNDIIENSNSIRKHCITENSEQVTADTQRLKENIQLLEKNLEATAV